MNLVPPPILKPKPSTPNLKPEAPEALPPTHLDNLFLRVQVPKFYVIRAQSTYMGAHLCSNYLIFGYLDLARHIEYNITATPQLEVQSNAHTHGQNLQP